MYVLLIDIIDNMNEKIIRNNLETLKHIQSVREGLYRIILELDRRMQLHDQSKLESPEQEIYGEFADELGKTEYGTPEYAELLKKVQPALDHHYAKNRHHPQHHANGVNDMNLVDIMEMLIDWKCSSERTKNGNIRKSIEHNAVRFEMSDQLTQILKNTIKELF